LLHQTLNLRETHLNLVESIGPDLAIASSNFKLEGNSFKFSTKTSKFSNSGKVWFNASFNERVSWQIKIKGTKSKAYKIVKGTSNVLDQSTSLWTGTQSGIYFFKAGEKAIAELSVNGSNEKWYDTTTISTVKGQKDYGPDALIWYDMEAMVVSGIGYWYAYFNSPDYSAAPGVVQWGDIALLDLKDPVQGRYRSMMAKSNRPNTSWVGGFGAADISSANAYTGKYGFPGASWNEVYLNFYIRRKTPITKSMAISVRSISGRTIDTIKINPFPSPHPDTVFTNLYTSVSYNVTFPIGSSSDGQQSGNPPNGYVMGAGKVEPWISEPGTSLGSDSQLVVGLAPYPNLEFSGEPEGWSLVSVRLDQMTPSWDSKYLESEKLPFDPSKIISISGGLGTAELTGFDIDFVVFTRGVPFNQLLDQIK
jgi:hypothetical protein